MLFSPEGLGGMSVHLSQLLQRFPRCRCFPERLHASHTGSEHRGEAAKTWLESSASVDSLVLVQARKGAQRGSVCVLG